MAPDSRDKKLADLVCPICFDLGFTATAFRGEVTGDEAQPNADSTPEKETEDLASSEPQKQENDDDLEPVAGQIRPGEPPSGNDGQSVQNVPKDSDARRPDPEEDDGLEAAMMRLLAQERTEGNPLVVSETMQHKDDGRIESLFALHINLDTVEPDVNGLLFGDRQPATREDYIAAFPTVQLIKNGMIPFKYWLEQPCPAHRGDLEPPCVAIRRGVHQYLLDCQDTYTEASQLLEGYGYVEEWNSSVSFRIGYPELGVGGEGRPAIPAGGWSVEAFMLNDIPSPWRRPWYPDDGFVLSRRTRNVGDNGSEEAFEKVKGWFRSCVLTHQQPCSEPAAQDLPDRLIDIGGTGESSDDLPKLVSTSGKRGVYACLSHRWGPETPSTTQEKVESYHHRIPWEHLSATFQDAITFLRKLSPWHEQEFGDAIRYIWIDSLCIVQDSDSDWKQQSQKMCDIYSNARLTLVESAGRDMEKRLFSKASAQYVPKPIQVKDAQGNTQDLYLRRSFLHPDYMVNQGRVPVWNRAWVLQERLLSRRLLVFGSEELSWQCQSGNQCECGLDQNKSEAETRMMSWKLKTTTTRLQSVTSRHGLGKLLGTDPSHSEFRRAWRLVLEGYSGLDMTFRKDTLPAIAGLARSFNKQLGDMRYFAGMFYEEQDGSEGAEPKDLTESLLDLLWRLRHLSDARRELPPPVIPVTWSWAAPQGAIAYPFVQDELLTCFAIVVHVQPAHNVPRLPADMSAYKDSWVSDMYVDAPSASLALIAPVWRTRLVRTRTHMAIKTTEDREYTYHLGVMSDKIWQHRALGKPVDIALILAQPPTPAVEEGGAEVDVDELFATMPPIVVYPDSLVTEITGPMFCMPLAKFRHQPLKAPLEEKIVFVALILEAVGHIANNVGTDYNLEGKDPGELVYRRLGLAYTTQGGWSAEHDEIIQGLEPKSIHIL